jgi:hypothetical protein
MSHRLNKKSARIISKQVNYAIRIFQRLALILFLYREFCGDFTIISLYVHSVSETYMLMLSVFWILQNRIRLNHMLLLIHHIHLKLCYRLSKSYQGVIEELSRSYQRVIKSFIPVMLHGRFIHIRRLNKLKR